MALEDRCTPQTASSPTGIDRPSPEFERMRLSPIPLKMSPHVPKTEIEDEPEINIECVSPAPSSQDSSRYYDEDDDRPSSRCHSQNPEITPAINFSITNILSDNFGKIPITTPSVRHHPPLYLNHQQQNKLKHVPERKDNLLFRPYDIQNEAKTKFYKTILDLTHENLFKLSAKNYPKIHEEVYNRSNGFNHFTTSQSSNYLSESSISKIPPLGGLCKAISQIGQKSPHHPPSQQQQHATNLNSRNTFSPAKSDSSYLSTGSSQINTTQQKSDSGVDSSDETRSESGSSSKEDGQGLWPAWVFCTRYSDRPSSGPRYRRPKQPKDKNAVDDKRPRTAFSSEQLARLKQEFNENRYLNERRRQQLSADLGLNEAQIKIWFQNKRAKIKKSTGHKNPLALQLMAQGLYNHTTVPLTEEEEELELRMNGKL